jgi:hypothetical protein
MGRTSLANEQEAAIIVATVNRMIQGSQPPKIHHVYILTFLCNELVESKDLVVPGSNMQCSHLHHHSFLGNELCQTDGEHYLGSFMQMHMSTETSYEVLQAGVTMT